MSHTIVVPNEAHAQVYRETREIEPTIIVESDPRRFIELKIEHEGINEAARFILGSSHFTFAVTCATDEERATLRERLPHLRAIEQQQYREHTEDADFVLPFAVVRSHLYYYENGQSLLESEFGRLRRS